MRRQIHTQRGDHIIAWFSALAITIHILENGLPSPLPGVKPGLANVVTIIVLCRYGWTSAAWVVGLRVLVGSILIGTFLSPTFVLSASGAIASLTVLAVLMPWVRLQSEWRLGAVGLSVVAALAHMMGQFFVAYFFFIHHSAIFNLLPILMSFAAVFGIVSGLIANLVLQRINKQEGQWQ